MRKIRSDRITFSIEELKQIEKMSGLGLTLDQISTVMDCSHDTIRRRINEGDEELSASIIRGRSVAILAVAKRCFELALEGDTGMIKYFLSARGGWSEKTQISLEAINPDSSLNLTEAQITAMAKEILIKNETKEEDNEKLF